MESMGKDPEKYSYLIYHDNKNNSSTGSYGDYYYASYFNNRKYPYRLNSYDSFFEALKSTLLQDADKLYEQLLKEQVNSIIADYGSEKNSSLLPTILNNQTYIHRRGYIKLMRSE